jgi:hypothetical protein
MTFSEEQMHRPIFEAVPEARIALQQTLFRFGGDDQLELNQLAQEYFNAAYSLVELRLHQPHDCVGTVSSPAIFLYRHSVELFLKAIIPADRQERNHDLVRLSRTFAELVKAEFLADVPDWILERLTELAEADPRSTGFRYHNGGGVPCGALVEVDCAHLQASMIALNTALVGVLAALALSEGAGAAGGESA